MKPLPALLQQLDRDHLVVERDFPRLDCDELLAYCRSAVTDGSDPLLHWDFGPVMELEPSDTAKNYLFSREPVPFHWDGVFFQVPHVLVFQCLEAPEEGAGGETLFCLAEKLYLHLPADKRDRWAKVSITYKTDKVAHYGGEVTIPLFGTHPLKGTRVVRFAEAVATEKNPVTTTVSGVSAGEAEELVSYFTEQIYSDEFCRVHRWQPGDLVLADNHSLMHGRRGFTRNARRRIRRIQIK
ncbi:MAG: TauD/TfdA family dioxygenase [Planctomycetota bacterium]